MGFMKHYFYLAIPVNPEPWTIGPVGVTNKGGKTRGFVGKNLQLDNYKEAVKIEAKKELDRHCLGTGCPRDYFPTVDPLSIEFQFFRRLDVYKTATGRKSSRNWADGTNMQKSTEDALQGILFGNDRDNMDVRSRIVEQGPDVTPGTIVKVGMLEDFVIPITDSDFYRRAFNLFKQADTFVFDNSI